VRVAAAAGAAPRIAQALEEPARAVDLRDLGRRVLGFEVELERELRVAGVHELQRLMREAGDGLPRPVDEVERLEERPDRAGDGLDGVRNGLGNAQRSDAGWVPARMNTTKARACTPGG
jgi:hypothetical protein